MKTLALLVSLASLVLVSCGSAPPADEGPATEPPSPPTLEYSVVYYPAGSVCMFPVAAMGSCSSTYPRLGKCWTYYGDQAVGCKWPVTGPVSYYVTCVLSCP